MTPRQRGAAWLLGLLCLGRLLDALDLPFEAKPQPEARPDSSTAGPAEPPAAAPRRASGAADSLAAPPLPIAINRASAAELQALPRVGPVLAARIVAHRDAHGPFASSADLQRVPGIGPRTAARLAPLLRFD